MRIRIMNRIQNFVVLPLIVCFGGVLPMTYIFISNNYKKITNTVSSPMIYRPDYLKANYHWRASPNFDLRPLSANDSRPPTIDTIVLHATEIPAYALVEAVFMSPNYKVSSHYTIDRDGTVYCHVDESQRAWHAGTSLMADGRERANDFSIGVELVNANDGTEPYPQLQINSLKILITDIKSRHKITQIVSHAEIATPPGRKSDPRNFPWDEIGLKKSD